MDESKLRIVTVSMLSTVMAVIIVAVICLRPSWLFFTVLAISTIATFGISARYVKKHLQLERDRKAARGSENSYKRGTGDLKKFCYEDVMQATNDFSTIIGQGGSGSVFKGMLEDGTYVAVKRMEGQDRGEREFRAEMAAIGSVQNRNLVHLYGYCIVPKGPRFLVYEYVSNGSLDRWIFGQKHGYDKPNGCLSWKLRYRVSVEVARALHYLHNDCTSRILHLDVKPENILLDKDFRAVVSDFGLAKLMGKEERMVVTRIRGTREYLAPEWILDNGVSAKSDVYSYGLVLLEMIGGRRNVRIHGSYDQGSSVMSYDTMSKEYFPKIVYDKMKAGKLIEVVDRRLLVEGTIDEDELRRLVYVALWCIQENVILRPNMTQVVNMLQGHMPVNEPPETKMFFLDLLLNKIQQQQGHNGIQATLLQISKSYNRFDVTGPATIS